jgi:hypothetical protein
MPTDRKKSNRNVEVRSLEGHKILKPGCLCICFPFQWLWEKTALCLPERAPWQESSRACRVLRLGTQPDTTCTDRPFHLAMDLSHHISHKYFIGCAWIVQNKVLMKVSDLDVCWVNPKCAQDFPVILRFTM